MTTQVYKHIENGKTFYTFNGETKRKSAKDYKYALIGLAKRALGASQDGKDYCFIALGNSAKNLISSYKGIYSHMELTATTIITH